MRLGARAHQLLRSEARGRRQDDSHNSHILIFATSRDRRPDAYVDIRRMAMVLTRLRLEVDATTWRATS